MTHLLYLEAYLNIMDYIIMHLLNIIGRSTQYALLYIAIEYK